MVLSVTHNRMTTACGIHQHCGLSSLEIDPHTLTYTDTDTDTLNLEDVVLNTLQYSVSLVAVIDISHGHILRDSSLPAMEYFFATTAVETLRSFSVVLLALPNAMPSSLETAVPFGLF